MRQFASTGFRIWNLSREAKLVYTGFALFALLGLASSLLLYEDMVGDVGARGYYAGETATVARGARSDGPRLDLPEEPQRPIKVAMPYRKLLEVTHFHLFTVPVFLLIVAHLFMLTGLSSTAKALWIISGWVAALLHLLAPWLVRYGPEGIGWIYALSGAAMAVTTTMLTVYPIVVMWKGAPTTE